MNIKNGGQSFFIILIATFILFTLSFVNWTDITKKTFDTNKESSFLKNFNIFSQLLPEDTTITGNYIEIDPALKEAMVAYTNNTQQNVRVDSITGDTIIDSAVIDIKKSIINGEIIIEDYSVSQKGMIKFKAALSQRNIRPVRIAIIGDSYIEGDIFTQNIREQLQTQYGGKGVGYVAIDCVSKKFRKSVEHISKGWSTSTLMKKNVQDFFILPGLYCKSTSNSYASFSGSSSINNVDNWDNSKFIFISPENSTIEINVGDGWTSHSITGSNNIQCISINKNTNKFEIKTSSKSIIGLGVWLNNNTGISIDCMSLRGYSGITHNKINKQLSEQLSEFINYDLIIIEYGLNVLSAKNSNYDYYANRMVTVVNQIRSCHPNAYILILGCGDRGIKNGNSIQSIKTTPSLISAQREVARRSQCFFWDTREAMGGSNAVVDWCNNNDINKDYIHLSFKGGERLANIFVKSLNTAINE